MALFPLSLILFSEAISEANPPRGSCSHNFYSTLGIKREQRSKNYHFSSSSYNKYFLEKIKSNNYLWPPYYSSLVLLNPFFPNYPRDTFWTDVKNLENLAKCNFKAWKFLKMFRFSIFDPPIFEYFWGFWQLVRILWGWLPLLGKHCCCGVFQHFLAHFK